VAHLAAAAVQQCHARLQQMVLDAVDRMRTSAAPLPVVVVGGGSILLRERVGDVTVTVPGNFGVANAVGAAMAQVSGEVDRVVSLDGSSREAEIAKVRADAEDKAVRAGANRATLALIDMEDVPVAYLSGNSTRIRVRVVGDLVEAGATA
jgi:hypothetical protein